MLLKNGATNIQSLLGWVRWLQCCYDFDSKDSPSIMQLFCSVLISFPCDRVFGLFERALRFRAMRIQVSQISEEDGLRLEHRYPEGKPKLDAPDREITGQPVLRLFAERAGAEVRLNGSIEAGIRFNCDRCLEPVACNVDEQLELFYIPSFAPGALKDETELREEDLTVSFYREDTINLDDVVREQIELALPMSTLCGEDCRGLCPECGSNLNRDHCSCSAKVADLRFAALSDLNA